MLPRRLPASLAFLTALAATCALPTSADAQTGCDAVASAGATTVKAMIGSLSPGQTGCLRGTLRENVWIETPGITLTGEPGTEATLEGQLVIDPDADDVTVRGLVLDGEGLGKPSPIVLGDDAALLDNEITNRDSLSICVILGARNHDSGALAERTRIEGNRIHDCGGTSNNQRHALYVENASDTRIVGNEIYDNADRAVQLYPNAQDTLVAGNVIDGNGQGVIFSGEGETSSNGNVVRNNIITNPRIRSGIESWYPQGTPEGRDNVASGNCVFGSENMVDTSAGGFVARDNVEADPGYADRAAKDFRVRPGSPCAALLEAGRSGVEAPRALDTSAPAPAAAAPAAPVKIAIARARGGAVSLSLRLNRGEKTAYARLEVRRGGRWVLVGLPRLSPGRTSVHRIKASGSVTARAVLLRPGRPSVASFRR